MKRPIRLLALFLTLILGLNPNVSAKEEGEPLPELLRFTRDEIALEEGLSCFLTEYISYNGEGTLRFSCDQPDVATVGTGNGFLRGEKAGYAQVRVSASTGLTASMLVKVGGGGETYDLRLDRTSMTLSRGSSQNLAIVTGAPSGLISWNSTNPNVALVENNAVKALAAGYTTLVATVPGAQAVCRVEVREKEERSPAVFLSAYDLELRKGATAEVKVVTAPREAQLLWSSSDRAVASVTGNDGHALIRGVSEGEATVTARFEGEEKIVARCAVGVGRPAAEILLTTAGDSGAFRLNMSKVNLRLGESGTLAVSDLPEGGEVRWLAAGGGASCAGLYVSDETSCTLLGLRPGASEVTACVQDKDGAVVAAPVCRVLIEDDSDVSKVVYSTKYESLLRFRAEDFVNACAMRDGAALRSVRFTPPSRECGSFYATYTNKSVHSDVDPNTAYLPSEGRNGIDRIVFVPAVGFDGVVTIPYTGADEEGYVYESAVEIRVGDRTGGFADVRETDWFAPAVEWAVAGGIAQGVNETYFQPHSDCTQAQILTFLYRAKGSPTLETVASPYEIPPLEWYRDAALWAWETGMVDDSSFNWYAPCTRAEAVRYLWIAAGSPETAYADFLDVPSDEPYAQAVAWAVERGVAEGTGNGRFSPDLICDRATILTFLFREFR